MTADSGSTTTKEQPETQPLIQKHDRKDKNTTVNLKAQQQKAKNTTLNSATWKQNQQHDSKL